MCDAFLAHPDRKPPRLKASGDDRSGNDVMLQLFEAWLQAAHAGVFRDAAAWREINSLKVGDLRSSGVCDVCEQTDAPDALLLCDVADCPCAVHTFCCPRVSASEDWRCSAHAVSSAVI